MTKKEMAFKLSKEIAIKALKKRSYEEIKGIQDAAEVFNIDLERKVMPITRYFLAKEYSIEEINSYNLKDLP